MKTDSFFSGEKAQLRRPNLNMAVADWIRELIFAGDLKPGSKVDQEQIAQHLSISKLPVREALISLESEALIRNIPRRGAFVAPLEREDIQDHYSIYGMVSGLAAERAAESISEESLEELSRWVDAMEVSSSEEEQEQANFHFHRIINSEGGSARLKSVLRSLSNSIPHRFFAFTPGWTPVAHHHHRKILEALRSKDGKLARELMEAHLRASGAYAIASLEERGFWRHEESG